MGTENFAKTRDHLRLWLERCQEAADAAPRVQQLYEVMDWAARTIDRCPPAAVNVPSSQLSAHADSIFGRVTRELPMILPVDPNRLIVTGTSSTSSSSAVVAYVENVSHHRTGDIGRHALEALTEYRQLQESHQRPEQVRALLAATVPAAVPKFDSAREAYQRYKSGLGDEGAAASEMRNFMDSLKGELFERARRQPQENMTLDTVFERLFLSAPTAAEVQEQFAQRSSLYGELSVIVKRRNSSLGYDVDALWARVLDHAFIVFNTLNCGTR